MDVTGIKFTARAQLNQMTQLRTKVDEDVHVENEPLSSNLDFVSANINLG